MALVGAHAALGSSLWFGLIPIALALVVSVRRISVERFLLLDNDGMILPKVCSK